MIILLTSSEYHFLTILYVDTFARSVVHLATLQVILDLYHLILLQCNTLLFISIYVGGACTSSLSHSCRHLSLGDDEELPFTIVYTYSGLPASGIVTEGLILSAISCNTQPIARKRANTFFMSPIHFKKNDFFHGHSAREQRLLHIKYPNASTKVYKSSHICNISTTKRH